MRRIATTVLLASMMSAGLLGCDQPPSKVGSGGVAVVDFQKLMERSGKMDAVRAQMQATQQQLNMMIMSKVSAQEAAYKKAEEDAKAAPGAESDAKVAAAKAALQKAINETAMAINAPQQMERAQMQMFGQLRAELGQVALAVALEKGMSVVMIQSEAVLNYTKDADITDAVLVELAKTPVGFGVAPGPGMGGPGMGAPGSGIPGAGGGGSMIPGGPGGPSGAAPAPGIPGMAAPGEKPKPTAPAPAPSPAPSAPAPPAP